MTRWILSLLMLGAAHAASAATPVAGDWEGEAASDLWPTFLRLEAGQGDQGAVTLFVLGQTVDLGPVKNANSIDSIVGEGSDAFTFSGHVEGDRLVGEMRQSGKTFAFSLQRIPRYAPTSNRVIGWSRDLDALRDRVLRFDRSFDAAEATAARAAIERLRGKLPTLSDDQVKVRIAAIMALADNAHTRLYLLRNRTEVQRMPIRLWWFGDEARVVRAAPPFEKFLGCRVDRIGGLDVRKAKAKVAPLFSGSVNWKTYMSSYSLTSPDVVRGTGIVGEGAPVTYGFSGCAAAGQQTIEPLPLAKTAKALESWWDLAPNYAGAADGWKQLLAVRAIVPPLYLSKPAAYYWFAEPAAGRPFYLQYNRAADAPDESVEAFAARVGKALAASHPKAVVVDLRFNTGGNSDLTTKLIEAVNRVGPSTPVYLIVGRTTFSAGIVAVADWRRSRAVTIVGEPVGDDLDFWSEGGNIVLPSSGLYAHFANGAHSLSPAPCPTKDYCRDLSVKSIAPDIAAVPDWTNYIAGRDPAMAAIERDMAKRR